MTTDGEHEGGATPAPSPAPSVASFDELYRAHVDDARRLATILVGAEHAEELVAESFARVLAQLRAGRGPRDNFRAYLHVTIRNGFRDSLRGPRESPLSDQPWIFDEAQPPTEDLVEDLEADTAAHAFATLPASWQKVLWHVEVEGRKPAEVADLLGMRAGAVSSLAHRAREGLRRAYLDQHVVAPAASADCTWTRNRLSQYVRNDLSTRAEDKVAAHLGGCEDCFAAHLQVEQVNRKLAAWIFPVVLLGALPASGKGLAWLVGLAGVGGAGGGASGGTSSGSSGTTAGAAVAAAAVVAVSVAGVTLAVKAHDDDPAAARTGTSSEPPADPGGSGGEAVDPVPADPTDPAGTGPRPPQPPAATTPRPPGTTSPPAARPPVPPASPAHRRRPVVVEATAPTAHAITRCDAWGSLTIPTTTGVSYARTVGDGRSGAWQVQASARSGYVLRSGSRRTFGGDLGEPRACVSLASVTTGTPSGQSAARWEITVDTAVEDANDHQLSVTFEFDQPLVIGQHDAVGDGWTCHTVDALAGGLDLLLQVGPALSGPVVCDHTATGGAPPPLTLHTLSVGQLILRTVPTGTVTLRSDGEVVGTHRF